MDHNTEQLKFYIFTRLKTWKRSDRNICGFDSSTGDLHMPYRTVCRWTEHLQRWEDRPERSVPTQASECGQEGTALYVEKVAVEDPYTTNRKICQTYGHSYGTVERILRPDLKLKKKMKKRSGLKMDTSCLDRGTKATEGRMFRFGQPAQHNCVIQSQEMK